MGISTWYYFSCIITKTSHQKSRFPDIMYSTKSKIHLNLTASDFKDINIEDDRDKEKIVMLMNSQGLGRDYGGRR